MISISDLVRQMWRVARKSPPPAELTDPRMRAAWIATMHSGEARVRELPELVNLAALTDTMRDRPVVYTLRPSISDLVRDTDLHSLPSEPPPLLRRGWILECRYDRGERLFGETWALAGYSLDGTTYLIGLEGEGARVGRWHPHWDGGELEEGVPLETSPLVDDVQEHATWTRTAAWFAVVFAILLDSEASPLRTREEREKRPRGPGSDPRAPEWITRHITIGGASGRSPDPSTPTDAPSTSEGRVASTSMVRGHLKRQRHGPGNTLTKYVYVAGYSARRWVSPTPVRVVVS